MSSRRVLILSAGMGAGHDGVAAELARRLAANGVDVSVADVLDLLPLRLGAVLRGWYRWTMLAAPWLYEAIYRVFFVSTRAPSTSPLTVLAGRQLRRAIGERLPDEIVSAFHVAAQVTGRLRARGLLSVPSTVLVTDFAVHRMWLHPGNDRYLCPNPSSVPEVAAATGRSSCRCAPVVGPEFGRAPADPARVRARIGAGPDDRPVLVAAGSWGVGRVLETARVLAGSGRYLPVVLCGDNERLRRRLCEAGLGRALGWRHDVPDLMAAAYALVDNAAGLTCEEAFAAGLPVVSFRPIAGHGRDGARAMADAGVSVYADDAAGLLAALDALGDPERRARQVARAAELFNAAPAEAVLLTAPV